MTQEELDAIRFKHHKANNARICHGCIDWWPCDAIKLLNASRPSVSTLHNTIEIAVPSTGTDTDPNRSVRFLPYGIDVSVLDAGPEKSDASADADDAE